MTKKLFNLFSLLKKQQKIQFIRLQFLVALMSSLEIISVFGITGFIALITNPDIVNEIYILKIILYKFNITEESSLIFISGAVIAIFLLISTLISIFTVWKLSHYSQSVGFSMGNRLFNHYLTQSWNFHLSINSSELVKRISTETDRVTNGVLNQVMQINSRFILGIFLSISIIIVDPIVAIVGVSVIGLSYLLIFRFVKNILKDNGQTISNMLVSRFKIMSNSFGAIRDLMISKKYFNHINNFSETGDVLVSKSASSIALTQIPRFIVETLAFILIILLIISLYFSFEGNLETILPIVSFYAFAGFKLIPCFQQIYGAFAQIRTHISAFDAISDDLHKLQLKEASKSYYSFFYNEFSKTSKPLFKKSMSLNKINFSYDSSEKYVLKNIDLEILKNQCIGITGPSGSGKSTLIDIILGLHKPTKGTILIDNIKKDQNYWQKNKLLIGYVPQDIYLLDGSILENILMGDQPTDKAKKEAIELLKKLNLNDFIENLSDGINTNVGERGVQLSGGQKQKIAIARCLYNKSELIVFDEATSSLDGASENEIMKNIRLISKNTTVILIAHRLSTLKNCDVIYFLENGTIQESGTYKSLSETNSRFKLMLDGKKKSKL